MKKNMKWLEDELVHLGLDFHWHSWENLGERFKPKEFAKAMESMKTRVAYLIAKCALGWSYYPTKAGVPHPKLRGDYFGKRLKILKSLGYKVIAYHCIGMEGKILQKHPEWQFLEWGDKHQVCPDDNWQLTSLESPYLEEVALPQIREIISNYQVDGIFLDIFRADDGIVDYSRYSSQRFKEKMGRSLVAPDKDPDFRKTWL